MNETTKNILIGEMERVLFKILSFPENNPIIQEISAVTDLGNLSAIFTNMKFFLKTDTLPKIKETHSVLPAVIFGLPAFQNFLVKELSGKISFEDIRELSASYLSMCKTAR
ncbi:MAG: hypothetical protein NTZ13_04705 [Candidatus Parcubacteria bacterium]|nr:hypothetical protein [Candidatus Parcubacteria bacterium]